MLINKTDKPLEITYNQKTIIVEPGKQLDVRDFGILNQHVLEVEKHLVTKFPGSFNQEKNQDILETNKLHVEKIENLEKSIVELNKNINSLQKSNDQNSDKLNKVLAENEGLKAQIQSLTKEKGELVGKLKAVK